MFGRRIREFYEQHVRALPLNDRLLLMQMISDDIEANSDDHSPGVAELEGLGAEMWVGIEAQDQVRGLREEWEQRL